DAEDPTSWPSLAPQTPAAAGPKGIAVATIAPDGVSEVDLLVYRHVPPPQGTLWATGIITVGRRGLLVGTEADRDVSPLGWPPGVVPVAVYVEGNARGNTRVMFVLGISHLPLRKPIALPADLIEQIDTQLGVLHQPHLIPLGGSPYPTTGLAWQLALSSDRT